MHFDSVYGMTLSAKSGVDSKKRRNVEQKFCGSIAYSTVILVGKFPLPAVEIKKTEVETFHSRGGKLRYRFETICSMRAQ